MIPRDIYPMDIIPRIARMGVLIRLPGSAGKRSRTPQYAGGVYYERQQKLHGHGQHFR
jgi:hypothetical protein